MKKLNKQATVMARTLLLGIGILLSCTVFAAKKVDMDTHTNDITDLQDALPTFYEIGDTGPAGGKVFYVDGDGLHGLEAAPTDQSEGIHWWNSNYTYTEARGDGVGAGEMNTMLIIANQGTDSNSYAAGICANLVIANNDVDYGDWYLPSKYELNLMWKNLAEPDPVNLGGFSAHNYWSSTESSDSNAWALDFSSNGWQGNLSKSNTNPRVRAVRAF